MLFTLLTVLVLGATFLGLAFHRFWTTREEARSTILYAEILKKYLAWLALRTVQIARLATPASVWRNKQSRGARTRPPAPIES